MEEQETKYTRAKKRVHDLKGFYTHLSIYLLINCLLQLFYAGVFDTGTISKHFPYWVRFTTPFFWGLSLAGHAIWVFYGKFFNNIFKGWEERKINEILERQKEEGKHWK